MTTLQFIWPAMELFLVRNQSERSNENPNVVQFEKFPKHIYPIYCTYFTRNTNTPSETAVPVPRELEQGYKKLYTCTVYNYSFFYSLSCCLYYLLYLCVDILICLCIFYFIVQ